MIWFGMPSAALQRWRTRAETELDEIESAHSAIGGSGPGRRYATLQLNHAYAVLISSQFQRFCRDLHSEAVNALASRTQPVNVGSALRVAMTQGRKLDVGNPNPGNIGSDFARIGMTIWGAVAQLDAKNLKLQGELERLNDWRNAIAHQDWTKVQSRNLRIVQVRKWRSVCSQLARAFDRVTADHLFGMLNIRPW